MNSLTFFYLNEVPGGTNGASGTGGAGGDAGFGGGGGWGYDVGVGATVESPDKKSILSALDRLREAAIKGGDVALAKADYWIVRDELND